MGCQVVNDCGPFGPNTTTTYEYEDQSVDSDVGRAATNEEVINVEAVTISAGFVETIPRVVYGLTAGLSFGSGSRDRESVYH